MLTYFSNSFFQKRELQDDDTNDPEDYLKGNFNQLFNMKRRNRDLKIYLSIGGWSFSTNITNGVNTHEKKKEFAKSAVGLLKNMGLDGIDIDWEFPSNKKEAWDYVTLLRYIREELNQYSSDVGLPETQFELSIAAPATADEYEILNVKGMDKYLDYWNVMCYDFSGEWDKVSTYHSNLYGGDSSCDDAINFYMDSGVSPEKIIMGMPTYGIGFSNTLGIGQSFCEIKSEGEESESWSYSSLPSPNCREYIETCGVSAYCYDRQKRYAVVYDNEETVRIKAEYVQENELGGGMWWEASTDAPINSSRSLVGSFGSTINHQLNKKKNCLYYPQSIYPNVKSSNEQQKSSCKSNKKSKSEMCCKNTSNPPSTLSQHNNKIIERSSEL